MLSARSAESSEQAVGEGVGCSQNSLQRLAEVPIAAVVIEGRYCRLHSLEHVSGGWLADVLTRLQVRYPEVQIVFADTRAFADDWTYRFLAAAIADVTAAPVKG